MPENRGMIFLFKRQHWLKSLTSFSGCIWIIQSLPGASPSSEAPAPAGCGPRRGEWGRHRAGMGTHCCCEHPVPSAWGAARWWIPTQLLIAVVQPWFRGISASPLLCWASPSSHSQSLAPSCTCWYLNSRSKFRKNWISPQLPVATDIFQRLQLCTAPQKTISVRANGGQVVLFRFPAALLCHGLCLILCDMWPSLFTANERDMTADTAVIPEFPDWRLKPTHCASFHSRPSLPCSISVLCLCLLGSAVVEIVSPVQCVKCWLHCQWRGICTSAYKHSFLVFIIKWLERKV